MATRSQLLNWYNAFSRKPEIKRKRSSNFQLKNCTEPDPIQCKPQNQIAYSSLSLCVSLSIHLDFLLSVVIKAIGIESGSC